MIDGNEDMQKRDIVAGVIDLAVSVAVLTSAWVAISTNPSALVVADEEKAFIFSGGSSPKQFLNYLAKEDLDWSKISLILSDERLVAHNDIRSNFRFIKKNLLERIEYKEKPKLFPDMESYCVDSNNYLKVLEYLPAIHRLLLSDTP